MPRPPNEAAGVPLLGAVEGGGTKFLCAVGTGPSDIRARVRIPTGPPQRTLDDVCAFFASHRPDAVGVAMFGPLELRGEAAGTTLRTPKPGWDGVAVRARLADALNVPIAVDTDVGAAAVAEHRWGAARGCNPVVYLTVGTGIGGGIALDGRPLHGLLHPEIGHLPMPRLEDDGGALDVFEGACPFHGRCLEGLASGAAIAHRLGGTPAETLGDSHPVWASVARYLAHGLAAVVLVVSPQRIVVGGGVMDAGHLLARVRGELTRVLAGYIDRPELGPALDDYVVSPALDEPGLAGAFALAHDCAPGSALIGKARH